MNDKAVFTYLYLNNTCTFRKYFPTYYFVSFSEKFPQDGQSLILVSLICERDLRYQTSCPSITVNWVNLVS